MARKRIPVKLGIVIIIGVIVGLIGPALLMAVLRQSAGSPYVPTVRYVSDYHLEHQETEKIERRGTTWLIKRDFNNDPYLWIRQWERTWKQPGDEIYLMQFKVFDSANAAQREYNETYNAHKAFEAYWEEGENWFISAEPDWDDATVTAMVYREDNVIIYTNVVYVDEYPHYYDDEETEHIGVEYDRWRLKDYIIEHAAEIRAFVLQNILGYEI